MEKEIKKSALNFQVGGNHYKDMVIQPVEFAVKNDLGFLEGNIIKYVCRHRSKNGRQDLEKAKHYIELALELYYPEREYTQDEIENKMTPNQSATIDEDIAPF